MISIKRPSGVRNTERDDDVYTASTYGISVGDLNGSSSSDSSSGGK